MGREKILLKTETKTSSHEISDFLKNLADKVKSGKVTLKQGDSELALDLPANLTMEIKVEEEDKGGKIQKSLEVELEWYEGDETEADVVLV